MAIMFAGICKFLSIELILSGIEEMGFFTVFSHTISGDIMHMSCDRRRAIFNARITNDAGLDDHKSLQCKERALADDAIGAIEGFA